MNRLATVPMTLRQEIQNKGTSDKDAAALCDRNGFNEDQKVDALDQTSKRNHQNKCGAKKDLCINFSQRNAFSDGRLICHCLDILWQRRISRHRKSHSHCHNISTEIDAVANELCQNELM
jgi:hypothetical protein